MSKKNAVLVLIALFVVFSGCVKINTEQKIDSSGVMETKKIIDFSEQTQIEPENTTEFITEFCENEKKTFEQNGLLLEFDCFETGYSKILITAREQLSQTVFSKQGTFPVTKYSFNLGKYFEISQGKTLQQLKDMNVLNEEDFNLLTNLAGLGEEDYLRYVNQGFEYDLSIEMPGKLVRTSIGQVEGNKIKLSLEDLVKLSDSKSRKIIESEENTVMIPMIVGLLLLLVLLVGGLVIYFYGGQKKRSPQELLKVRQQKARQENEIDEELLSEETPFQQTSTIQFKDTKPLKKPEEKKPDLKPVIKKEKEKEQENILYEETPVPSEKERQELEKLPSFNQLDKKETITPKQQLPIQEKLPEKEINDPPFNILTAEEEKDVKGLLEVLGPEKQNYSKEEILHVVLEKGYSRIVASEVIHRLYG